VADLVLTAVGSWSLKMNWLVRLIFGFSACCHGCALNLPGTRQFRRCSELSVLIVPQLCPK